MPVDRDVLHAVLAHRGSASWWMHVDPGAGPAGFNQTYPARMVDGNPVFTRDLGRAVRP